MVARTVLLADADPDSLAIYSMMLEHHGFVVLRARDADEALRRGTEEGPGLIVADPFLFGRGRPLAALLRQDPRTAGIPLIGLTALPASLGVAPGQLACDAFLLKPCVPSRLLQEVQRWFGPAAELPQPRPTGIGSRHPAPGPAVESR